jgi:hypothetical protein
MKDNIIRIGLWIAVLVFAPAASAQSFRPFTPFTPLTPLTPLRPFATPAYACPAPVVISPHLPEAVTMRLKFEKGKSFFVETTTQTKQQLTVNGENVSQRQDQVFVEKWTPERMTADGAWLIRLRIVHMRFSIDIGGNKIEYDSRQDAPRSPTTDFFEAIVNAEFTAVVQPNGGVGDLRGREELLKKLAAARAVPSAHPNSMKSVLTEESLKKMFAPLGIYLPGSPVRRGDSWSQKENLDFGPIGRYQRANKYTFQARAGSVCEIRVGSTLTYTPPSKEDAGGLGFTVKNAKLQSTSSEGNIFFDTEKGRLKEAEQTMHLAGSLRIDVGGTETDVELDQTQSVGLRTMDAYADTRKK